MYKLIQINKKRRCKRCNVHSLTTSDIAYAYEDEMEMCNHCLNENQKLLRIWRCGNINCLAIFAEVLCRTHKEKRDKMLRNKHEN